MNNPAVPLVLSVLVSVLPARAAESNAPLALVQTIPLPGVEGRLDRFALDAVAGPAVAGEALPILGIARVAFQSTDLEASGKFYTGLLGCEAAFAQTNPAAAYFKIHDGQFVKPLESGLLGTVTLHTAAITPGH